MALKMLANSATRQVQARATKKSGTSKVGGSARLGGAGYRKYDGDALWLPNTTRPEWLDGSLPGDRGFDPLGLSRPSEFVLIGVDGQDQNLAQNKKGDVDGVVTASPDQVSAGSSLAPYSEVFGLARFRECELIHGRWAMLATLGCLAAEGVSGVSWVETTVQELEKASYLNLELPFSTTTLAYINPILIGGAELYRNSQSDPEKRCYPGGFFDPLKLASEDPERAFNLKTAEIKHARLAMVAFLGYLVQVGFTGKGALGSLAAFGESF